jgi:hypothetical protein
MRRLEVVDFDSAAHDANMLGSAYGLGKSGDSIHWSQSKITRPLPRVPNNATSLGLFILHNQRL